MRKRLRYQRFILHVIPNQYITEMEPSSILSIYFRSLTPQLSFTATTRSCLPPRAQA